MSAETEPRSLLVRVLDGFLQERNIKWLLSLGVMILLASSVMLVTSQWDQQHYTPFWKYLTLLTYAGGIFGLGQWSYHRACLRKTGTVLMALTVLLTPLSFIALRWVQLDPAAGVWTQSTNLVLLAINFALSLVATQRIFTHFLRGPQPTLIASFLTLCLAGAILPGIDWAAAPLATVLTSLGLWSVFAIGSVKAQRQVFWLTEEHRAPRIFGFFPILLLGMQFLLLFAFTLAPHMALSWIGLGCVMTAAPVLLTADAVARVFQQRTGDLVRPLPWSIGLPLFVGLGLNVLGVCLAGSGLNPPQAIPLALTPAAGLAALLMALVARRTGHRGLVWAMLLLLTVAYNFSFAFFREAATVMLQHGAVAVQESRLPFAFYGLTYLPLLSGLTVAAAYVRRRGITLFAGPIQIFTLALGLLLLIVSMTHIKALAPVGLVLGLFFVMQMVLLNDRRLILPALIALLTTTFGAVPFAVDVLGWNLPSYGGYMSFAILAGVLLALGPWLDRFVARFDMPAAWKPFTENRLGSELCQALSLAVTFVLCQIWLLESSWRFSGAQHWPVVPCMAALLIAHSLRWKQRFLGGAAYLFTALAGLSFGIDRGVGAPELLLLATGIVIVQWIVSYALVLRPMWRVSCVYESVFRVASLFVGGTLLVCVVIPQAIGQLLLLPNLWMPLPLLAGVLLALWAIDAARHFVAPVMAWLGYTSLLVLGLAWSVATWGAAAYPWLPAGCVAVALAALPLAQWLVGRVDALRDDANTERRERLKAIALPLDLISQGLLTVFAFGTLLAFSGPLRIAGCLAAIGLLLLSLWRKSSPQLQLGWASLNWQILAALPSLFAPQIKHLALVPFSLAELPWLPLACGATCSLLAWQMLPRSKNSLASDLAASHRLMLGLLAVGSLAASWFLPALSGLDIVLAGVSFALIAGNLFWDAYRTQKVEGVWLGELVLAIAACYFFAWGVIPLGRGFSLFVCLGLGAVALAVSRLAQLRESTHIFVQPLLLTAHVLPALTVPLALARHLGYGAPAWMGLPSLALLLAAGFYCWQALESGRRSLWLLSAAILNLALALLWRELSFTDPQFYLIPVGITLLGLVQLLKRDIPQALHNPLRYCGALVILVSPTFHIVGGSWLHLLTLLVTSVAIVLVSMAIRVRALMYTGTAFLVADLVAMVVRGSLDQPNLLWIVGLGVGASVVALGAVCENHREHLQQRLRMIAATLQQWD